MDFKWKNGQLFQKFSEMTGKSGVASMEIIADGTQANENPAAAYRGLGCISANNASRLLLDYKVEHPKEYEEIMRPFRESVAPLFENERIAWPGRHLSVYFE